jgi:glycosyltransferase involved in cell wall biosynthesis
MHGEARGGGHAPNSVATVPLNGWAVVGRVRPGVSGLNLTQAHPDHRTVFLVAEEVGEAPDEGYAKVTMELGRALRRNATVLVHVTPQGPHDSHHSAESHVRAGLRRMRAVVSRGLRAELKLARPATVVYLSRSSVTLSALVRSRLLKWTSGGARIVMIALQPRRLRWPGSLASRMLWPDLVLVSTDDELRDIRGLGAKVARMVTGVDLERFRPARPGEKAALRLKWGIPGEARVVLHVGHLTEGRNLEALLPLAAQPGYTMIVVTSSQRGSASGQLENELRSHGVVMMQGFLSDIDEIYRLADCYVFPTTSTDYAIGMPLSVLEALATGLPVAAMRFGALPERFGNADGVLLVDTAAELVEAVGRLLSESRSTRTLSEGFSWSTVAEQVAAV